MSTDPILGKKVHEHLIKHGLETPMTEKVNISDDEKIDNIKHHMAAVMETLGLDLTDDSLVETPKRIAKMYVKEFFAGLNYANFPKCTTIENKMSQGEEFVMVKDIKVVSLCEHHFLPFMGTGEGYAGAVIAYIPKDKVIGLSKLSRIVEFFAARGQVQERLTQQIMESLRVILETDDVAVYMEAQHTCMSTRGVKDTNASTVTCAMNGQFLSDDNIRKEFLSLCRK